MRASHFIQGVVDEAPEVHLVKAVFFKGIADQAVPNVLHLGDGGEVRASSSAGNRL